ncbi:ABC transporter ATP-binding protein [bacterium]|nr:ABC transporter ATP-binding protein [bacterium]
MKAQRITWKEHFRNALWLAKTTLSVTSWHGVIWVLLLPIIGLSSIVLNYFSAQIVQELIHAVEQHISQMPLALFRLFIAYICTELLIKVFTIASRYFELRKNYLFDEKIQIKKLEKIAQLDIQYHEDPEFQSMIERTSSTLGWRGPNAFVAISNFFASTITSVMLVSILLTLEPIIIILLLIPIYLNYLVDKQSGERIWNIWSSNGEDRKHASHALYGLSNLQVLQEAKIYGFANYLIVRFRKAFANFNNRVIAPLTKQSFHYVLTALISVILFTGIHYWLLTQVLQGNLTIGNYTFYLVSLATVSSSFTSLQRYLSMFIEQSPFLQDTRIFFSLQEKIKKPLSPKSVLQMAPKIEFRNVSFKYPNSKKFILKNVSFTISPTEKIAIVGENGAGKSTLVKLLARFYDVTSGEILINDVNIRDIDLTSYYKLWGVLLQRFAQYWFTVRENIGLSNIEDIENTSLVQRAAKHVGADKMINKLTHKYETSLSTDFKDGVELSGGQWQSIGIARGIFADPTFIILDEPTSALDALAEEKVFTEINAATKQATTIIISHRFATIRNVDKVFVLDKGIIVEQGNHQELMIRKGLYYKMFTAQAKGYE